MISGKAIDGYIKDAKVCLDTNYNTLCDSGETSSTTKSGGEYTLSVTQAELDNYPIVVETISGVSYDEQRGVYFTNTLRMTAPAGVTTITPITTMVQKKIKDGTPKADAETQVANLLEIPSNKLYSDYIADDDSGLTDKAISIAGYIQDYNGTIDSQTLEQRVQGAWSELYNDNTKEVIPLAVNSTYPTNGATNVGPYGWLDINFSDPIDVSTMTQANIALDNNKTCTLNYIGGTGNTVRCYPYVTNTDNALDSNTTYNLTIKNIKSSTGGDQNGTYMISFTTGEENILPRLKTGATQCYDDINNITICGDANASKDDAWYAHNGYGIDRNFNRDNTLEIVDDLATGLQWQDSSSTSTSWDVANTSCESLSLDGEGWRLPSIKELTTILDLNNSSPAIFPEFNNISNAKYWSSSAQFLSSHYWIAKFSDASTDSQPTTESYYSICVKNSVNTTSDFIRDDNKQIVLDTSSGLMWQDDTTISDTSSLTWSQAITHCGDLTLGGYTDWRLPNRNELRQLATEKGYMPSVFNQDPEEEYWTSTTYAGDSSRAWYQDYQGFISYTLKDGTGSAVTYTRCVRGGK
ncbi:MAG: DUF1566 domain-containing protein [Campylobacterales bacterium]